MFGNMYKEFINQGLAWLTLAGGIFLVLFLIGKIFKKRFNFFQKNALLFAFIVSLIATLGSLFFSEIMLYEPCKLCWYQRIFMYPQVILFGVLLYRREKSGIIFSLIMSVIGALIAGFHYVQQIFPSSVLSCDVLGYSVSCVQTFFLEFGYITIPMMALTAFLMLIVFAYLEYI